MSALKATKGAARPERSQALDDLIMGTNSSSITSKRSVERLYCPNEPHFFRFFVKKPQRRAPLINRGYWLRLRAIDVIVRQFLERPSSKKKVVINLGCGSDVLPWQCHVRYPQISEDALFVDIDYPDLMRKKRAIVLQTPQLRDLLGTDVTISEDDNDPVLLKSAKYCQLACDLRELEALRRTLESILFLKDAEVLFVAEVSITYMDTASADALIKWGSGIGQAEFCLLEQILPNGPDHPFAKTMLRHFEKLNTPIKSVQQYPTIESQRKRFKDRAWAQVEIWDLWEAWSSSTFMTSAERMALDQVEPFDEWEELMLFGRHYSVLHAQASSTGVEDTAREKQAPAPFGNSQVRFDITTRSPSRPIKRRFGQAMTLHNSKGQPFGAHLYGMGADSRSDSYDLYRVDASSGSLKLPIDGPGPRMCYTLTDLGDCGTLLVGGRSSPSKAFRDCWILPKGLGASWQRTWDLPKPLYRHNTCRLGDSSLALVIGGRNGSVGVSDDSFLFDPEKGWVECQVRTPLSEPLFGAVLCCSKSQTRAGFFKGLYCGGLRPDGTLNLDRYTWELDIAKEVPLIQFSKISSPRSAWDSLSVFGAEVVTIEGFTVVCGGTGNAPSHQGQTITVLEAGSGPLSIIGLLAAGENAADWPFMIGSSIITDGQSLKVFGGGATCFSMGTFWESRTHRMELMDRREPEDYGSRKPAPEYLESPKILLARDRPTHSVDSKVKAEVISIPRMRIKSSAEFEALVKAGKPAILEDVDLGTCREAWTPEKLMGMAGSEQEVVAHECPDDTEKMDFNSKNFRYVTDQFKNIIKKIQSGGRLYIRSLSTDNPTDQPANLENDFPSLAEDFALPEELAFVKENLFSSVLRISGRVNMWLHYDVMANVYAQVHGSKRMILFPPSDVSHLSFAPGASSSSLDVFASLESTLLQSTHPHEAILRPGDVLFLPPMWLHTATPTSDLSIAVNIFFRDLQDGYSTGRDVYGNRDLAGYEKGRLEVAKIAKNFEQLPADIRRFYLDRLADELRQATGDRS